MEQGECENEKKMRQTEDKEEDADKSRNPKLGENSRKAPKNRP